MRTTLTVETAARRPHPLGSTTVASNFWRSFFIRLLNLESDAHAPTATCSLQDLRRLSRSYRGGWRIVGVREKGLGIEDSLDRLRRRRRGLRAREAEVVEDGIGGSEVELVGVVRVAVIGELRT